MPLFESCVRHDEGVRNVNNMAINNMTFIEYDLMFEFGLTDYIKSFHILRFYVMSYLLYSQDFRFPPYGRATLVFIAFRNYRTPRHAILGYRIFRYPI